MCFSCKDIKQNPIQTKQKITSHKIFTNKGALNNSMIDSTLLAPDFSYPTLNGEIFTLSEHRGKVIVLNIWGTWCGPCINEIPGFIDLQNEFKDKGVEFVGISIDSKG
jgi:thiol-disulfide isomerase/thioredoxin